MRSRGSIHTWLDSHPSSVDDYEIATSIYRTLEKTRRRPAKQRSRVALGQISGNRMASNQASPQRRQPPRKANRTPSPSKDPAKGPTVELTGNPSKSPQKLVAVRKKGSKTRGKVPSLGVTPKLDQPSSSRDGASSTTQSLDDVTDDISTSHPPSDATGSVRNRSPVRHGGDLKLAETPVLYKTFHKHSKLLPQEMVKLMQDMEDIGLGVGVVPQLIRAKIESVHGRKLHDMFFQSEHNAKQATPPNSLNDNHFWARALEVLDKATACASERLSESSWNDDVHSTILDLALRGEWESKGIWYYNVTSAKISVTSLLLKTAGITNQSKMVDYVLVQKEPEEAQSAIRVLLASLHSKSKSSLNQTNAHYVKHHPIGVSAETKAGPNETMAQLGTWVTAQFEKLRQLIYEGDERGDLKPLPLLLVQGHHWKLKIAVFNTEKNNVDVFEDVELGSTNTALGVYRIVAAVRRLARWIHEEYWPWFKLDVLGLEDPAGDSAEREGGAEAGLREAHAEVDRMTVQPARDEERVSGDESCAA
ncbi:hypothetical protein MMC21_006816 [Puttea exsequens]|nr:hypothetical protein [Puttea exsequens]